MAVMNQAPVQIPNPNPLSIRGLFSGCESKVNGLLLFSNHTIKKKSKQTKNSSKLIYFSGMGHNVVIAYLWVVASTGVALNLLNAIVIWLQMKQLKENIKDHTVTYVSMKV